MILLPASSKPKPSTVFSWVAKCCKKEANFDLNIRVSVQSCRMISKGTAKFRLLAVHLNTQITISTSTLYRKDLLEQRYCTTRNDHSSAKTTYSDPNQRTDFLSQKQQEKNLVL